MNKFIVICVLCIGIICIISPFVFANNSTVVREDVKAFILSDQTDKNEYIIGEYVCRDYANDVVENAREQGFDAYRFSIHQVSDTNETHAIVLFKTSDGDIYVDVTQADNWVFIDFKTMQYEVYAMVNNKFIESSYIDWYLRGK